MTRMIPVTMIALLGLAASAHAQTASSSGGCGPETWSTDKMAYVGVPCSETAAVPQQASLSTDLQYCTALVKRFDTYINKDSRRAGMMSTDVAARVAAEKCRAGDTSGISELERALTDAKVNLPPRS